MADLFDATKRPRRTPVLPQPAYSIWIAWAEAKNPIGDAYERVEIERAGVTVDRRIGCLHVLPLDAFAQLPGQDARAVDGNSALSWRRGQHFENPILLHAPVIDHPRDHARP